ncbi:hypothetical protein FOA52_014492 [Chlamydomonas sp. UWO 241]|nr:hypothetical protein FOA52_014492 [Chlamydomonas sp. UWO 241]
MSIYGGGKTDKGVCSYAGCFSKHALTPVDQDIKQFLAIELDCDKPLVIGALKEELLTRNKDDAAKAKLPKAHQYTLSVSQIVLAACSTVVKIQMKIKINYLHLVVQLVMLWHQTWFKQQQDVMDAAGSTPEAAASARRSLNDRLAPEMNALVLKVAECIKDLAGRCGMMNVNGRLDCTSFLAKLRAARPKPPAAKSWLVNSATTQANLTNMLPLVARTRPLDVQLSTSGVMDLAMAVASATCYVLPSDAPSNVLQLLAVQLQAAVEALASKNAYFCSMLSHAGSGTRQFIDSGFSVGSSAVRMEVLSSSDKAIVIRTLLAALSACTNLPAGARFAAEWGLVLFNTSTRAILVFPTTPLPFSTKYGSWEEKRKTYKRVEQSPKTRRLQLCYAAQLGRDQIPDQVPTAGCAVLVEHGDDLFISAHRQGHAVPADLTVKKCPAVSKASAYLRKDTNNNNLTGGRNYQLLSRGYTDQNWSMWANAWLSCDVQCMLKAKILARSGALMALAERGYQRGDHLRWMRFCAMQSYTYVVPPGNAIKQDMDVLVVSLFKTKGGDGDKIFHATFARHNNRDR